jgi:hypothetical protein
MLRERDGGNMLKKTGFSLFGLALVLGCMSPPQAHAGVVVALVRVYPHPVYQYVRPYPYVAPPPFFAYRPNPLCLRAGTRASRLDTANTSSVVPPGGGETL